MTLEELSKVPFRCVSHLAMEDEHCMTYISEDGRLGPDTEFCTEYESGCCGTCCWFKHEDTDGWGMCYKSETYKPVYCGAKPCADGDYVSNQAMRHYLAVLLWHNRWRRGKGDRMQDPKEIGKAIDFAVDYIKTFKEL